MFTLIGEFMWLTFQVDPTPPFPIAHTSPPHLERFTIPGWFMFFWMSAGKNLDFETALQYLDCSLLVLKAKQPFFWGGGGLCSNIDATSAESSDRAALTIRPVLCLMHFVFICSLKQVIIWDVPIQPVTLAFFSALGLPVLLHWIRLTLELGARGISAALKLTSEICRQRGDKGTLKYAFLSQPWYLWHQHSNPLPQTPTLEGICGCLINTNRNKAWSLCPHLLYVFPAIK